jgi:outer membrane receptor protein involved in Fe transport
MKTSGVSARYQASRLGALSALAIAVAAALPAVAQQQQQQQQQQAQTGPSEEIIVTGSRVTRSGFDSSQPLTTIDSQQIENLGLVNVGDVVRTLPQNTPFFTETNVGIGNFNVGAQLANLRGLNPFFGTRTLTLVDTRRVVPTTEGGAVDLTLIPSMLVERTEVVTGGASAQYGSDAIAGVVNVILDKDLEGMKAQVDYGQTAEGDGGDTHASFAWGTAFADDGRGHVIAGLEYQNQDRIGPCSYTRDWCAEGWGLANNGAFNTPAGIGNGRPNFIVSPNAKQTTSQFGVIQSCLTAACVAPPGTPPPLGPTLTFNADGTDVSAFSLGVPGVGFAQRIGGDGTLLGYGTSNVRPEVERYSALAHVSYDLSDRLHWFGEVAYSSSDALGTPANGGLGPTGLRIQADNAFLSPAVVAALGPNGGQLARIFMPDVINARNTTENDTTRFVTGLDGALGEKWTWDVYYQHGKNENHQRLYNNMVGSLAGGAVRQHDFLRWALDAVRDPANPNNIICRATIVSDPTFSPNAAGCVPLNIFGNGNADPRALEYVYRTLKEDNEYTQDVLGMNFRSTIAEGWAGPIGLATGFEWRTDEADTTHDIPNQPWYNSYLLSYGQDRGGDIDVLEAYAELDVPMSQKLNTNFSARQTRNEATSATDPTISGSDTFASWKAAAIYDPLEWLRFRATLSRDVRAAGFRELFLPRVSTPAVVGGFPGPVTNPWNANANDEFLQTTGGNPNLDPEEADTKTFGTVLSFDRFRLSADWFEIDLGGAITQSPGNQPLVDQCFRSGGTGDVCGRVTGFGTPNITAIDSSAVNLAKFLTRGWDYEATVDFPLQGGGNINLRVIGTYLYDMIVDTGLGTAPIDYRGQSGPVASFGSFNTQPDWQARAWVTYSRDRFMSTFETRYVGSGSLNVTWFESPPGDPSNTRQFSVNDNSVDDAYYLSWSGSYDFRRSEGNQMQLFWVINNLLDEDPPVAPGGNAYPTNPVFFDTLGLRYRAGFRIAF